MTQVNRNDIDTAQAVRFEARAYEGIERAHTQGGLNTMRGTAGRARAASTAPARPLRRLACWLSALLADDGMSTRFAAERQRDDGVVSRVERQRRP